MLVAGLRPRRPLPPEPDPYRAGEAPLAARAEDVPRRVRCRPMDRDDLAFAGLARHADLIAAGELTSRELTELFLSRIARLDPLLNAFRVVLAEQALRRGRRRPTAAAARATAGRCSASRSRSRTTSTSRARSPPTAATPTRRAAARRLRGRRAGCAPPAP